MFSPRPHHYATNHANAGLDLADQGRLADRGKAAEHDRSDGTPGTQTAAEPPAKGGRQPDARKGPDPRKGRGPGGSAAQLAAEKAEAERHPGLQARIAAALILRDIVAKGHAIEERFSASAVPNRLGPLDGRDRALVRSIVTAALRRLGTLRAAIAARLEQGLPRQAPDFEWTLIVAAAQILLLDVPDHAAVDLAVRAVRLERKSAPFAPLANAVLRAIARSREEVLAGSDPLDQDVPAWLGQRWRKNYGEAAARLIAAAVRCEPTLDITVKGGAGTSAAAWAERLGARVLPTGSLRVAAHTAVDELPGYAEGEWWVQDAAAALPASFLKVRPGQRVADLCAAPGGKAAQLAAAGAELTAIDRSAERLKRLSANFARLGLTAELLVADVTSLKAQPFDAVLLDAPCLGTGTLRRHPDISWTKKPGDLASLVALQVRLIDQAVNLTATGGTLVYCTCSIEPEEGEAQIASLLRRNPDVVRVPIEAHEVGGLAEIINAQGEMRSLPCHLAGPEPRFAGLDGFFAARLAKRG